MKQVHLQPEIAEPFVFNSSKQSAMIFRKSGADTVMTAGHREEREASEMNREYHGGTDRHS